MDYFHLILILVILGLMAWMYKLYRDKLESDREVEAVEKEMIEHEEMGKGLAAYQQKLNEKKQELKAKIMNMVADAGKVSNRNVSEKLGVSRTSAFRYLNELEAEGEIKQVGKTGKNVFYADLDELN